MITKLLTIFLSFMFVISLNAQKKINEETAKKTLNSIFELCKTNSYEEVAKKTAYDGKDEVRYLKDTFNYANRSEASKVKRIAKKIKAFLDISDSNKFGNYKTEKVDGRIFHKMEVYFNSGKQQLKTEFTFIAAGSGILLVSLN